MEELERKLFGRPLTEVVKRLSFSRRLEQLWKHIESEFSDEGLSLDSAASRCGMSRSHLNARLGEDLGLSFHQFLTRYRLLKAIELFSQKDYTFLEIVHLTGFDNLSNFGRHFEKVLGCTPREFRSRLRSLNDKESDSEQDWNQSRDF